MGTSLNQNYKNLINVRRKYGELRKFEFHIHTPASHDYRVMNKRIYHSMNVEEIIQLAYEVNYYNEEQKDYFLQKHMNGELSDIDSLHYFVEKGFDSFKEFLTYQLIAHKLYENEVEIAVISDHNTISGYKKLERAINDYYLERLKGTEQKKDMIKLLLGIEITCSEKIHLVGIFDDDLFDIVNDLIKNHIPSQEMGTYETSLSMIEKISNLGGIAYIAHINTTDLKNTTGLYKQTLFNNKNLNVIGLTSLEVERHLAILKSHGAVNPQEKFCFLYEGDSHQIDEIGKKSTWIKMSQVGFNSLKKAIYDHKLCVFIEKPNITDKYIKGMLVEPGKRGYLKGKNGENSFIVDFSNDLNCIIGGRGTGKSTVINILEVIFTLECNSYDTLKFISENEYILVNFVYNNSEFILRFIPQIKKDTYHTSEDIFEEKAFIKDGKKSGNYVLQNHWVELYKVEHTRAGFKFLIIDNPTEVSSILENVYRKSYSINNIINQINNHMTGDFIKEVVFNGLPFLIKDQFLRNLRNLPSTRTRTFLSKELSLINVALEKRKKEIDSKLSAFNNSYNKQFQVVYSPKAKSNKFYLEILLFSLRRKEIYLLDYNITWENIESFILDVCEKIGFLNFLILLVNNKFTTIESYNSIIKYVNQDIGSIASVNRGRKNVNKDSLLEVYRGIRDNILANKKSIIYCLENYFEAVDDFSLLFNINSKENVKTIAPFMKDISELSLGQKVVSILTFIFEYGKFSDDNTPLIIDQPEDNLDNQYIYKNLVSSLKQIKNSRQIIIVTHSSTIVTNADAEQVIVLESDNKNGWVVKKGYPDDDIITRHIINYLEGGADSFRHKIGMYQKVLTI
ncbi:Spaf_1101 family AAA-like ATPase [Paenibacillus sp. FSL K6-2524]|uniref:Spaf_1101 family AAA-like ATPase n=1 Tax=Paenibacillus sp. FSL K6-2524 TaxID=2954516 RepID=UPI0030F872DB